MAQGEQQDIVLSGGQWTMIALSDIIITSVISFAAYEEYFHMGHKHFSQFCFTMAIIGLLGITWLPLWSVLTHRSMLWWTLITIVLGEMFPFAWMFGNILQLPASLLLAGGFVFFDEMCSRDVSRANIYKQPEE